MSLGAAMNGMTWHRLRGHKITRIRRDFSGINMYGEYGFTRHIKKCSCGEQWQFKCVNPLTGEWRWR